ncbi:phage tail tape measure protein [Pseudomonas protegens]|uniref:phage tail tape measure protein n=1 Tax=Pseudomonas protegens TaxID=380021 RepID=UPI000807030B|nr:phage tail tape measure protein [Pseudomonas protegens]OBZ19692.1 phage tail tape measure protein [Pseudomonas protegens]OBZ22491.1 phage tail tape measure protein [Pseudomonas protegens]OKK41309.1 phage tail tape measure protein [Pseudomonas protegens]OKK43382.1 phage tail tape measure protein [Pseudomonas protegens]OKK55406.1 phage tail tape measure protein [Pseudomonas protegens]
MADRSARLDFILALTDKVTAPLGKVKMGFSDLAEQSEKNIKTMGLGLAGMTGAFVGINQSLQPALEMNRALGEVRSLGVAEDALTALNQKSLEFSVAYGENARDFVASAYSIEGAIKGLTGSQLATFTNTSNLLAKATKSDAETLGAYVGTMYNLFKGQADAMGKAEWVEKLGGQTALAVQLFRTDGAQLKDAFKEVGAIATAGGVDIAEQFAVIGSLSSTMEGGDAGGRYKAFFENIGAASDKLGIKFTDQQGRVLPVLQIMEKLQGKLGDLTSASAGTKLLDAFGGEGAQVIGALAKDTDRLRQGLDKLGKVRGLEDAEKMAQAMVDPWQQFAAAVEALRIAFGQALIPILTPLMAKLSGIASTLTRWTQLFPNITRVVGIATLGVLAIIAAMSLLTFVVGASRMAWMAVITVWKVVQLLNLRTIAGFLLQAAVIATYVAGLTVLYTTMGIIRVAMMLWQGVIWLVNVALTANPIGVVVMGIAALVAIVIAAVYYWDEWTGALMNTEAFKWVLEKLQALSAWFDSMGGWSGMAKGAWDAIVGVFYRAINSLIEMINKIPGVNIEARLGDMPQIPGAEQATNAADVASAAQKAQQTISAAIPSIAPTRPNAVPPGGLLTSIQNTSNQNKGTHVESVTIHTGKAMTPLELENMMGMAVSG